MPPVWVIPSFNPCKYSMTCFCFGLPGTAVNEFALQACKETFRHRVIVGIANGPHGWPDSHFFTALAKGHTGVLTRHPCIDPCTPPFIEHNRTLMCPVKRGNSSAPFTAWDLPKAIQAVRDRILQQPKGDRASGNAYQRHMHLLAPTIHSDCEII